MAMTKLQEMVTVRRANPNRSNLNVGQKLASVVWAKHELCEM